MLRSKRNDGLQSSSPANVAARRFPSLNATTAANRLTSPNAGTAARKPLGLSTFAAAFAILALLTAALVMLPGCSSANPETEAVSKAEVGSAIPFGDYQWRVLAKENGKALLITEDVIDTRVYSVTRDDITWEDSTLRNYLNGDFYKTFNDNQQKAIVETKNANPDNPDYGAPGGNETTDKVFCLSIDEAGKYFADDDDRMAKLNGEGNGWWLRSPGQSTETVAYVASKGEIVSSGFFADLVESGNGGVRPAMWVAC